MKKRLQTWGALLMSVFFLTSAISSTACATSASTEDKKETKDEYTLQMEKMYKEEPETNELTSWPKGPGIYGEAGIVMDAETGAVLYGKNINQKEYPASITKILTALLALEYCEMEEPVSITAESLACLGSGYASIGMKEGDVITMEQALYAMLLSSSNEVAHAVGETVAKSQGKEFQWFLDEMNRTVEELGGTNSNFVNTNGVHDENHYTCARDMALIAKELFKYPEFFTICQTASYTIPESATTEEHVCWQKHEMLVPGNTDYYEYAVGGKTGYTTEANNTLVTMADNGSMKLVCVTLNIYPGHIYSDTKGLLDYGFENFEKTAVSGQEDSAKITSMPQDAAVTLPSGLQLPELDSDVKEIDKEAGRGLLSYSYEGNIVGEIEVEIKETASSEKPSPEKTEKKAGTALWKKILVSIAAVIGLLILWIIFAAWCRRRNRRRRRRRRRYHRGRRR